MLKLFKYNVYTTTGRRIHVCCERELTADDIKQFIAKHNPTYVISCYFQADHEPMNVINMIKTEID